MIEQAPTTTQGRRGGRRTRQVLRKAAPLIALPTLVRNIPVYEVLNEEGVELIHERSMRILEEVGIDFRDDEALALWREAGADVSGQRVRIQRELVMSLVAQAPSEYTLHGRNPDRTVRIGGHNMVFAPTYGSPYILGLDGTRRWKTFRRC